MSCSTVTGKCFPASCPAESVDAGQPSKLLILETGLARNALLHLPGTVQVTPAYR
jgi:hypothetical protein